MVVFSKLLEPIDEDSHRHCTKPPQAEAAPAKVVVEPAAAIEHESAPAAVDDDEAHLLVAAATAANVAEATPPLKTPRDDIIDELTQRLSKTFRLEEKVIETVSPLKEARDSSDKEAEEEDEDTPATSSSSSSCSGTAAEHREQEASSKDEEVRPDLTDGHTTLPLPRHGHAPDDDDSIARPNDEEEEKKDDSQDAQELLSRLEQESRRSAEAEIERILRQQVGVDEAAVDTLTKSNLQEQQQPDIISIAETILDPLAMVQSEMHHDEASATSEHHHHDDEEPSAKEGSLADFANAKADLSMPMTPERSGASLVDQQPQESTATAVDELEQSLGQPASPGDFRLKEDEPDVAPSLEATASVSEDAITPTLADSSLDANAVSTENGEQSTVVEPAIDDERGREGSSAELPAIEPETQAEDVPSLQFVEKMADTVTASVDDSAIASAQAVESSVDEGLDEGPAVSGVNTGTTDIQSQAESEDKPLTDVTDALEAVVVKEDENDPTGQSSEGDMIMNDGQDMPRSIDMIPVASVDKDVAKATLMVPSCSSDDSGVLDAQTIDVDGSTESLNECTSPVSPGKKKKSFFGKLKKALTHKEGSPTKIVLSPVCIGDVSEISQRSLPNGNGMLPIVPDLQSTETALLPCRRQTPEDVKAADQGPEATMQEFIQSMTSTTAEHEVIRNSSSLSEQGEQLDGSTDITRAASQTSLELRPVHEISISPQNASAPPGVLKRRPSVQASHEVAHVFRPPRLSSAASTPVQSRAASPHPSQGRSPGSSQLSTSSSLQYPSQHLISMHMRPHLPTLAGPRESFCLPSQPRKESATRMLTRLIRKDLWSSDSAQVESALLYLAEVAGDPDKVALIARTGGLLAIVNCMEQHTLHAGIQVAACNALEKLALDSDNETAIGEVGGVEAIQGAMMTHFGDKRVQEAAWSALWNLSCGNADCSSLNHAGLVASMTRHSDDAQVQRNACGTLANLCLDDSERLTALAHAGGFVAIASALEKFWREDDVKNEAAHALVQLLGPAAETYEVPENHLPLSSSHEWSED